MLQIVCAAAGTVFFLLWIELFFRYNRSYDDYIASIEKGQYLLPQLFFIGFGFIEQFHVDTYGKYAMSRIQLFAELQGEQYSRYYFMVNFAGQFTYVLTMLPIGLLLAAITDPVIAFLFLFLGVFLAYYLDYDIKTKVEKRREAIMISFPHVLSKMSLLIHAGMPLHDVIKKLAYAKEEILYTEFGIMQDEIRNGVSEREAMKHLADRCGIQEIRKFSSIMIQNMEKGSREMAKSLTEMADAVWRDRKNHVRQLGEKASAKLMLPIMMIFVGIMIMVIVPMFASVGGGL